MIGGKVEVEICQGAGHRITCCSHVRVYYSASTLLFYEPGQLLRSVGKRLIVYKQKAQTQICQFRKISSSGLQHSVARPPFAVRLMDSGGRDAASRDTMVSQIEMCAKQA